MSTGLNVRVDGEIAWLTIAGPQVANAIDSSLITAFHRTLDELGSNPAVRCLVLTGEGSTFCSGIDLHAIRKLSGEVREDESVVARKHLDHLVCRLLEFRIPTVAAVNGPAIGAGMTLALTADLILMSNEAYLQPSFTRLGFVPDQGITYLLPRLIGAARARAVFMLADRIDARTALDWGLAYRTYTPKDLVAGVQELAGKLASGPTRALGVARRLCFGGDVSELHAHMDRERSAQESALHHRECLEGVEAFLQKRQPEFHKPTK